MRLARSKLATTTIAIAAGLVVSSCGGTVDFSIVRDLSVDSSVDEGRVTATYDLAAEAGGAWKQRKHIDSLSIRSATAEVSQLLDGNAATTVGGSVWVLPPGVTDTAQGVLVGTWTDESVTVGNVIVLQPSEALDDFITQRLKGDGKFSIVAQGPGSGGDRVHVKLHVVIDVKLKWKPF